MSKNTIFRLRNLMEVTYLILSIDSPWFDSKITEESTTRLRWELPHSIQCSYVSLTSSSIQSRKKIIQIRYAAISFNPHGRIPIHLLGMYIMETLYGQTLNGI